ncbi:hypothetical protein D3C71_152680 [compost metagenome]
MLEQIIAAVTRALEQDLPEIEEETWGIVNNRAAQTGTIKRRPAQHDVEIYSFPQSWGSTALGFGGVGGQMMTTAQTTIVSLETTAWVYIGGQLAYCVEEWQRNEAFIRDMQQHHMAAQFQSFKRYKKAKDPA